MHITLVNPPTISCVTTMVQEAVPPLGLAYLCAAIEAAGFGVSVVDAVGEALAQHTLYDRELKLLLRGLRFDEIVARVPKTTGVIGVSCMFSDAWCSTRDLVLALRRAFPTTPIVLGGEHATACATYILETCASVDYIVLGEGEVTIVELLHCLENGRDPSQLPGVAGRAPKRGLTQLGTSSRRPRIKDIDTIPRPSWDAFPLERYIEGGYNHGLQRGRSMPILASRGCPYQCTFCSSARMWTTRWKARDPADVIDEMKHYVEKYGVNDFTFYDLTTIVRREWILEFCERLVASGLDVTWQLPSGTRSEAVDAEVARALYRAGCRNLNFAPESGSPTVLERIKKRVKIDRLTASVKAATEAGIEVKVNIILGFPFETMKELRETAAFVAHMATIGAEAVSVFPFCPYPGSELFEELLAKGKVRLSDDYFKNLVFTDYGRIVSYSDHFSVTELRGLVLLMNLAFYGVQFATHPRRLPTVLHQLLTRQQSGKVSNALEPMRKRQRAYRELLREERSTHLLRDAASEPVHPD